MKSLGELLKLYTMNPKLVGGFGQTFGRGLIATDKYENDPKRAFYMFKVPASHKNIQQTCHGGALATLVDVATTVSILRLTSHRTISISLNTEYLSVIKLDEEVGIETEVTKIGKNVVFSDCRIYTDVHSGKWKLACRGSHIKSVIHEKWDFLQDKTHQKVHEKHHEKVHHEKHHHEKPHPEKPHEK